MTKMPYLEEIFGISWKDQDLKKKPKKHGEMTWNGWTVVSWKCFKVWPSDWQEESELAG